MPLQTQFMTFFISPFSELSASAELNNFLKSHRIINVEKRLIDGERGTGWRDGGTWNVVMHHPKVLVTARI